MKVYIMTDLEGVAGVLDAEEWILPTSRYYEEAKRLLTAEVNAAAKGFFDGGATQIIVQDGHGHGGINCTMLDKRVEYQRGWNGPYPFGLEVGYDVCAWVGQHAMSRTELAHMPHTGSFDVYETRINDIPVGEFTKIAWCALEYDCLPVFACGDRAFAKEAKSFFPGIETVSVKRGVIPGAGDNCDASAYKVRNAAAVHIQPERACELIEEGALKALKRFNENPKNFAAVPTPSVQA
jgi:D-amino peptidase